MDPEIRDLVQAIHDTPGRVMIVTAGSGTQALAWLLGVAGASRTLLEALIPYDESSFDGFLNRTPEKYVSADTAGLLAGRAVTRARQLYRGSEPVVGLACTATIITDRPKRGQHRAHIVTWTPEQINRYRLQLQKGARDRDGEEQMVSRLLLNALAEAYGLPSRLEIPLVEGDRYFHKKLDILASADELLQGDIDFIGLRAKGRPGLGIAPPRILFSGAFNPLHDGHLALADVATEMLGQDVFFELAAVNADKTALEQDEIARRLVQFAGRYPVVASRAPRFIDKARLFPGSTFLVGYDTAERVLQPRFYGGDANEMMAALDKIGRLDCRFLVAGRVDDQGIFHESSQLPIPEEFRHLFIGIPSSRFRKDISSTEMRARGLPPSR